MLGFRQQAIVRKRVGCGVSSFVGYNGKAESGGAPGYAVKNEGQGGDGAEDVRPGTRAAAPGLNCKRWLNYFACVVNVAPLGTTNEATTLIGTLPLLMPSWIFPDSTKNTSPAL